MFSVILVTGFAAEGDIGSALPFIALLACSGGLVLAPRGLKRAAWVTTYGAVGLCLFAGPAARAATPVFRILAVVAHAALMGAGAARIRWWASNAPR